MCTPAGYLLATASSDRVRLRMRMSSRLSALVVGTLVALVLAFDVGPTPSAATRGKTIHVRSDAQFAAAERALRGSGGTIVMLPHLYRHLVVGSRSARHLRIVGTRGA